MRRQKLFIVLLAAFSILFISGCKQNVGTPEDNAVVEEPDEEDTEDEEQNRLFGFSCPDLEDPFYTVLKDSVSTALQEQGDRILVRDAQEDTAAQISHIQEMIDSGVSCVFLCPCDPEGITPALEALHDAGIPVINLDVRVEKSELTAAFIGADDYNAGKVCAEDLMARFPDGGSLAIVECPEVSSVSERINGFEETISSAGFEVVKRIDVQKDSSVIRGQMADLISSGNSLNAVMCGDDEMALEVLASLETAGRTDAFVYSVGGSPAVKSALVSSESPMTGIGALSPINMGKTAVKTASAVLENGVYEPETYVETFFINRDNVDMYGTDGWQ
ncbi:MAG TPA: substrate-binding domain-containing protein [Candidatus Mediterraneibacter colneyensis]|nr:substrate-binding domain-containing protein [Candidatus Mediterraneibacter colneyensis]